VGLYLAALEVELQNQAVALEALLAMDMVALLLLIQRVAVEGALLDILGTVAQAAFIAIMEVLVQAVAAVEGLAVLEELRDEVALAQAV